MVARLSIVEAHLTNASEILQNRTEYETWIFFSENEELKDSWMEEVKLPCRGMSSDLICVEKRSMERLFVTSDRWKVHLHSVLGESLRIIRQTHVIYIYISFQ